MSEELIEVSEFTLSSVDCFEDNSTLWFRLSDIAKVLEVGRSTASMWKDLADEDELVFKKVEHSKEPAPYGSESLLYRILNRSNSPKAKPFERWVTKEVIPSIRKNGSYSLPKKTQQEIDNETKKLNLAEAEYWRSMGIEYSDNKTFKQILDAYSTKAVAGKFVLPLPKLEENNYSATEVGKQLGISANKVGAIAKKLGLKVDGENGHWYVDKSPYSNKEVNMFRYSEKAIELIRKELEKENAA